MMKKIIFCTLLVLLITIAIISAGCDYVPDRDIIVVKLLPDGTTGWTKTIDTGFDDSAGEIIPTSDGGCVIAAQNASGSYGPYGSRLIRLSPEGNILLDSVFDAELTAAVQTGDGGFAALGGNGNLIRIGPQGDVLWETGAGIGATALIETSDGGFAVAGTQQDTIPFGSVPVYDENGNVSSREPLPDENVATPGCHEKVILAGDREITVTECTVPFEIVRQAAVARLDSDGRIVWKRAYGGTGMNSAGAIAESTDGTGFLVAGYQTISHGELNDTNYIAAVLLDEDGKAIHAERIGQIESFAAPLVYEAPGGYDILYVNTTLVDGLYCNKRAEAHFDADEERVTSVNILDTGVVLARTDDGGYFTAGFPKTGSCAGYSDAVYGRSDEHPLHAALFGSDGNRIWEREIDEVTANYVKKVVRTDDGGFLILALKENYY